MARRSPTLTLTIGLADDQNIEIRTGVKAGEMVIVQGQAGLPDGATITIDTAAPTSCGSDRKRQHGYN